MRRFRVRSTPQSKFDTEAAGEGKSKGIGAAAQACPSMALRMV